MRILTRPALMALCCAALPLTGTVLASRASGTVLASRASGTVLASRASGTVLASRASGTVLASRASGTVLASRASGTVLASRASGTTGVAMSAGHNGNGNCYPVGLTWVCIYNNGGPGGPGGPGSGGTSTCTYVQAPASVVQAAGLGPPMPGYQWDIMTCPGQNPGPGGAPAQLVQVSVNGGVPAVTPFQLMQIAVGELVVPVPQPATAPPRGRDGLVGLPEWFWVQRAQWQPVSITVRAGPVWATATGSPMKITFDPGGGLSPVSCAGPGTPFDRALPADRQHTACSYAYGRSSARQPGHAFAAAVTATWTISWTGSGGTGGVITTGYLTQTAFSLRVAQAEALVTTP